MEPPLPLFLRTRSMHLVPLKTRIVLLFLGQLGGNWAMTARVCYLKPQCFGSGPSRKGLEILMPSNPWTLSRRFAQSADAENLLIDFDDGSTDCFEAHVVFRRLVVPLGRGFLTARY